MLDLAFGWLLARPAVASVIAGATKPEQVTANVAAGAWRPGCRRAGRGRHHRAALGVADLALLALRGRPRFRF